MPSTAYHTHFEPLLADAESLLACRVRLRPLTAMRPHLGAISRALVVTCVSAWESYIEELVREVMTLIRPATPPLGSWPALNATVRGMLGRFNTPNTDQIRQLYSDALGLSDLQQSWSWPGSTASQARERLQEVMEFRHQIAHGVNPRPVIDPRYARTLLSFFRRLARCTDSRVREHLAGNLGLIDPWPE